MSTARLIEAAADELERLNRRVMELEQRLDAQSAGSARSRFRGKAVSSHPSLVSEQAKSMIRLVRNHRAVALGPAQSDGRAGYHRAGGEASMTETPCSVVVADDHPLLRRGLVDVLQSCPALKVVGEYGDGISALEAIRELSPDVAVLDIAMPGANGLDILVTIAREGRATKVVYLTATITDDQILTAIGLGAKAILFKETAADDLVSCGMHVADGGQWFPEGLDRECLGTRDRTPGVP